LIIKNKRKDNVPKRVNLLKSYYNKNGNPIGNLYNAIPFVKIKKNSCSPLAKNL